jgi:hypothetical protein
MQKTYVETACIATRLSVNAKKNISVYLLIYIASSVKVKTWVGSLKSKILTSTLILVIKLKGGIYIDIRKLGTKVTELV